MNWNRSLCGMPITVHWTVPAYYLCYIISMQFSTDTEEWSRGYTLFYTAVTSLILTMTIVMGGLSFQTVMRCLENEGVELTVYPFFWTLGTKVQRFRGSRFLAVVACIVLMALMAAGWVALWFAQAAPEYSPPKPAPKDEAWNVSWTRQGCGWDEFPVGYPVHSNYDGFKPIDCFWNDISACGFTYCSYIILFLVMPIYPLFGVDFVFPIMKLCTQTVEGAARGMVYIGTVLYLTLFGSTVFFGVRYNQANMLAVFVLLFLGYHLVKMYTMLSDGEILKHPAFADQPAEEAILQIMKRKEEVQEAEDGAVEDPKTETDGPVVITGAGAYPSGAHTPQTRPVAYEDMYNPFDNDQLSADDYNTDGPAYGASAV